MNLSLSIGKFLSCVYVGKCVTAPTVMWVKALDMLLDKLRVEEVDFSR